MNTATYLLAEPAAGGEAALGFHAETPPDPRRGARRSRDRRLAGHCGHAQPLPDLQSSLEVRQEQTAAPHLLGA
jgi:hypothetical protein